MHYRPSPPLILAGAAFGLTLLAASLGFAAPQSPQPTPDQASFFEKNVRPVFLSQCVSCHGSAQQRGGLRLDTAEGFLKGGGRGALLAKGHPEQSLLLKAVAHRPGVPPMPPGRTLSDRQLADLTKWVEDGAPWPAVTAKAGSREGHWSFQPLVKPAVPRVKNAAWVKTPIDAFILADLERNGLKPAPAADRRTLIRRATFDLTGLPPTPEEVEGFVNDKSPDAWSKVIERLLASTAYGERWGRHWLDVERYADSNGLDENVHYGNAWRYRDWVVKVFNEDKPYDRFLLEQLAGDLLPADNTAQRNDQLIATGFLAIGPKFISEVDSEKVLMDMADEQVDTVGRTLMGLTLGCARCHDHKFDPISTKDYYALAGIFHSTKTLEVMKKPRMWWEYPIATDKDRAADAAYKRNIEELKSKIAAAVKDATEKLKTGKPGVILPKNPESQFPEATRSELKLLRGVLAQLEKDEPELPACMGLTEGTVGDLRVNIRGDHTKLGDSVPRRFPVILAGTGQQSITPKSSGRLELAKWLTSPSHPLTARVMANRVWRWHFGRGIVASTENFGLLGERPTNQPLLDWLAATFREGVGKEFPNTQHPTPNTHSAWSVKDLHRLMMLSSTYQMSSAYDPKAAAVDPANKLHWRADLQRLEAEEVRDSILAVGGLLDRTMGGRALQLKNREYIFDHTSIDHTKYDSRRRTIYLPIVRNNLYDVLRIFDFGDGAVVNGDRPTTTVAPQALFMLNSDMVMDAAEAMAARVLKEGSADTGARVDSLYRVAYGRPATPREQARAASLLAKFQQEAAASGGAPEARTSKAWAWYCQTLLAANEFIYLR